MTYQSRFDALGVPQPVNEARARRPVAAQAIPKKSSQFAHYLARPILRAGPILFALAVTIVLTVAWLQRDEGHLTAESGVGYWLGIAGAILMLLLVGYPLRKRVRSLQRFGRVANWFRFHMIVGILGPTLVVLHTNFKLGSLNSKLALLTMLIVVASGIVGRYIYAKVHKGLYGRQIALRDVHADLLALKQAFNDGVVETPEIAAELAKYLPDPAAPASFIGSLLTSLLSGTRTRASRKAILQSVKAQISGAGSQLTRSERRRILKDADRHLRLFFAAAKTSDRLAFFDYLFGLWHHLHLPLFVLLAMTVVIHIVAVHLY